jgi:hypothetical protein
MSGNEVVAQDSVGWDIVSGTFNPAHFPFWAIKNKMLGICEAGGKTRSGQAPTPGPLAALLRNARSLPCSGSTNRAPSLVASS